MANNDDTFTNPKAHSLDGALFANGEIIGGRYKVISLLGKGGMGLVYKVEQVISREELALKTIHKNFLNETTIKRFENEARATFAVNHPNIISVKAYGLLDDQTPFMAMEIVDGETIAELLQDSGSLPIEVALPLIIQVCFGLAHAHENAVVHRDIKPSNIMIIKGRPIGTEGSVKILDFGIAKFSHREGGEIQALTKTGEIFGSPLYMSPEQCSRSKVDQRSDIYSLGCVIFETLTGKLPFKGNSALATLMMHQTNAPPRLGETSSKQKYPEDLERIVAKMLAKDPADRYQNLGVVAHDLSSILNRSDSSRISKKLSLEMPDNEDEETGSSIKRSFSFAAALVSLIFLLAIAVVSVMNFNAHRNVKADRERAIEQKKLEDVIEISRHPETKNVGDSTALNKISIPELEKKLAGSGNLLDLRGAKVTAEMLEIISKAKHIDNINFLGSNIDNGALEKLSKLQLTNITLSNSTFNDLGAQKISQIENLRTIKANDTTITNKGLGYLSKLNKLSQIKIEGTNVDIDGLRKFCRNKLLQQVSLANCPKIKAQEQEQLAKQFPKISFVCEGLYTPAQ